MSRSKMLSKVNYKILIYHDEQQNVKLSTSPPPKNKIDIQYKNNCFGYTFPLESVLSGGSGICSNKN